MCSESFYSKIDFVVENISPFHDSPSMVASVKLLSPSFTHDSIGIVNYRGSYGLGITFQLYFVLATTISAWQIKKSGFSKRKIRVLPIDFFSKDEIIK